MCIPRGAVLVLLVYSIHNYAPNNDQTNLRNYSPLDRLRSKLRHCPPHPPPALATKHNLRLLNFCRSEAQIQIWVSRSHVRWLSIAKWHSVAPKKAQKMSLNAFLEDSSELATLFGISSMLINNSLALGSWADEMDALPTAREFVMSRNLLANYSKVML